MKAHALVPALLPFIAAGCGGGGEPMRGPVNITAASSCSVNMASAVAWSLDKFPDNCPVWQIDGSSFETDQSVIHLSGSSFAPESNCKPNIGGPPCLPAFPGNNVRWENNSNGLAGSGAGSYAVLATVALPQPGWYLVGTLEVAGWSTQNATYQTGIPLKMGANSIRVSVEDRDHIGSSEITVTRVVDTTPPTVYSVDPAPNGTFYYRVLIYLAEQLDPQRVAGTLEVVDSNGQPVAGAIVYDALKLTLEWRPGASLTPGATYSARLSNIADLAGNTLTTPYAWSFKAN